MAQRHAKKRQNYIQIFTFFYSQPPIKKVAKYVRNSICVDFLKFPTTWNTQFKQSADGNKKRRPRKQNYADEWAVWAWRDEMNGTC